MNSFDRIKPPGQRLQERESRAERRPGGGSDGRAALVPDGPPVRRPGAVLAVHCSRCDATTPMALPGVLRSALPLFLVAPWKRHPVFAVCPACVHRAWLHPLLPR